MTLEHVPTRDLLAATTEAVNVLADFYCRTLTGAFNALVEQFGPLIEMLAATDQQPYDDEPDGCWATSDIDEEEACNSLDVDELGLCVSHRSRIAAR